MNLIPLYKAQPPFMDFKRGFGSLGVLMEDMDTGKIQCHLCGELFKSVARHVQHRHDMTADDYRAETGLGITTPLVCGNTSLLLRESGWVNLSKEKLEKKRQLLMENSRSVHRRKAPGLKKFGPRSVQMQNLFGTCELQAQAYFWELYKKNGNRVPDTKSDEKLRYLVYRRFTSYDEALKAWGVSDEEIVQKKKAVWSKQAAATDRTKAHPPTLWDSVERVKSSLANFVRSEKRGPTFSELGNGRLPTRFALKAKLGLRLSTEIAKHCEDLKAT